MIIVIQIIPVITFLLGLFTGLLLGEDRTIKTEVKKTIKNIKVHNNGLKVGGITRPKSQDLIVKNQSEQQKAVKESLDNMNKEKEMI